MANPIKNIIISLIFLGCLSSQITALTMGFQSPNNFEAVPDSQISTIKFKINNNNFKPGDYVNDLPDLESASSAGLKRKKGITVECRSDKDADWYLKIQTTGFRLTTDSSVTIPETAFRCAAFYAGLKPKNADWIGSDSTPDLSNNLKLQSYTEFETIEQTLYWSSAYDKNHTTFDSGTQVEVSFDILIPPNQQAGTYTTDLIFTLTQ